MREIECRVKDTSKDTSKKSAFNLKIIIFLICISFILTGCPAASTDLDWVGLDKCSVSGENGKIFQNGHGVCLKKPPGTTNQEVCCFKPDGSDCSLGDLVKLRDDTASWWASSFRLGGGDSEQLAITQIKNSFDSSLGGDNCVSEYSINMEFTDGTLIKEGIAPICYSGYGDFEDGEIIIPKGKYGMPCARYIVRVPKANLARRLFWAGLSLFSKDEDEYLFLGKTNEAIEASDEAFRNQLQIERTHKAERDALEAARDVQKARAETAEADLARAKAEGEARETAQELGNAVRLTQDVYTLAKGIGHDLRREASRQIEDNKSTLERIIQIAKDELGFETDVTLFEDNNDIHTPSLQRLLSLDSTPDSVKILFEYVLRTDSRADLIHTTATSLMEEIIDSTGKVDLSYNALLNPIVSHLNAAYDDVDISFEADPDDVIALYGSKPSLQTALVNIITNAADASKGGHVRINAVAFGHMTSISVSQTGSLSYEKALDLSTGKHVESTREGGTGTGSQVAFGVLRASGGSIRYFPTTETTQAYARIFVPNSLPED